MHREFTQHVWNDELNKAVEKLVALAVEEDTRSIGDLTSMALIPPESEGSAMVVSRRPGVAAGIAAVEPMLAAVHSSLRWIPLKEDGASLLPGDALGKMEGPVRPMLTAERLVLNLLGKLCGVATMTSAYVRAVAGTGARLYDTRKTTLGWRLLEKYAVRCGGGKNHRTGLYDAVLIKDNHLAHGARRLEGERSPDYTPAEAVLRAKAFLKELEQESTTIVEVEVDSVEQLQEVLPSGPEIVLLDNMSPEQLAEAVVLRDRLAPEVELEASGGITLETIRAVAESGVDRISSGALTHSAIQLDLGLDWLES